MIIAKLWAKQIINGKKTFKLKELVKEVLIERGQKDLMIEKISNS